MKTYTKILIVTILCGLCMSAIAGNRFIVKYKLNEKVSLSAGNNIDEKKDEDKIKEKLMEKLSIQQLEALSKAADTKDDGTFPSEIIDVNKHGVSALQTAKIQVEDLYSLATGAHVITLSKDLNRMQTEQFTDNVKKFDDIEYIEEDEVVSFI